MYLPKNFSTLFLRRVIKYIMNTYLFRFLLIINRKYFNFSFKIQHHKYIIKMFILICYAAHSSGWRYFISVK